MSDDIIVLARRHTHIASHYEGCEADHIGCLVNKLADEVERQRAEIERLREALVLGSEVLASHQGSAQREWHSVGAWLYPGDSINVVCAPLSEIKVEP